MSYIYLFYAQYLFIYFMPSIYIIYIIYIYTYLFYSQYIFIHIYTVHNISAPFLSTSLVSKQYDCPHKHFAI